MIKHQILDVFPRFPHHIQVPKPTWIVAYPTKFPLNLPFIAILNAVQTIRFLVLLFHSFPSTKNPFIPINKSIYSHQKTWGSWFSMNKILIFHGFPWISWPHFMAHHGDHPELILNPAPARRRPGSSAASRPAPG